MDKLVGVAFQPIAALGVAVFLLGRAAKDAFAVFPHVRCVLKTDVALHILKVGDRVFTVGVFRAVHAPPPQQAGQLSDGNAVKLLVENVVHPLLQIGDLILQPHQQPLGDLPQKHTGFAGRVYVSTDFDTKEKALSRANAAEKGLK